ncbi:MAG TPA: DUF1326 domain-containing protein [Blastocatellia bacterium]|nr:DUF1326 domain-containing protein [Blastocatellia bacterium]
MRRMLLIAAVALSVHALAGAGNAQQISGDYMETRSADIYTGPCVANGEVGLVGDQAILGWHVKQGSWGGVSLDGLGVVGVVKAGATLGDIYSNPYPAKAVMIVDEKASLEQRGALISFAKEMAGKLFGDVIAIEVAPITMEISHERGHYSRASMHAGSLAGIETRSIGEKDHLCGNEVTFYPPLTKMDHAMPAVAELDQFKGKALGVSWTLNGKRSAFVGTFSR